MGPPTKFPEGPNLLSFLGQVVRIYGKRWDIEVFFRTAKQQLDLEMGCQTKDFDALIAHASLHVLVLEQRRHDDPRTLGLLFHACCDEMREFEYLEAFQRLGLCQALMTEVLQHALYMFGLKRHYFQKLSY